MRKAWGAALLCGAVAGCASNTGIISTGGGGYLMARQAATGFSGLGNIKGDLITEASSFCRAKGLDLKLVSESETQPPYILGNYPRAEIRFECK
jgi:hypothetical protein